MTFNEAFTRYFHPDGFRNFIPLYLRLLEDEGHDLDEEAFVGEFQNDPDTEPYDFEGKAKEASALTRQAFALFRMIVRACELDLDEPELLLVQTALHESLLKTLYYIDLSCHELLESQAHGADCDIDDYLNGLLRKHPISESDLDHLRQKWFFDEHELFESLTSREYKLKLFKEDDGEIVFQVFNSELEPVLSVPKRLCTSNQLIVSRYYFVLRLFDIFRHLDLITSTLEAERPDGVKSSHVDDFFETDSAVVFNEAADELRNKVV